MAMFQAAVLEMRGTHTSNPKIIEGKKALYKAKTVTDFRAVHLLFQNTTTRNGRISEGKRLIKVAAEICDEADNARKQAKVLYAADCASAAAAAGPAVAAAGPATSPPRAAAQCIVLSAPAPPSYIDRSSVVLAAGGAGTKRPAACVIVISDDEDEPCKPRHVKTEAAAACGCMAKDNAAEKAPAKVVYAVIDGKWQDDVYELQYELRKIGKFDSSELNVEAKDELRTLPYEVALILLGKIRDETTKIADMNAFIVNLAQKLRTQWNLDDAKTISKQIEPETVEDTESEQDDAGDAHEAEQEPTDVDSNGNSIEY